MAIWVICKYVTIYLKTLKIAQTGQFQTAGKTMPQMSYSSLMHPTFRGWKTRFTTLHKKSTNFQTSIFQIYYVKIEKKIHVTTINGQVEQDVNQVRLLLGNCHLNVHVVTDVDGRHLYSAIHKLRQMTRHFRNKN
jgi:hypothetical protein